jgi:hypothetical protein
MNKLVEEGAIIKDESPYELSLPKSKWALLEEKTPSKYIKKRKGRGGMELDYVETGYIIKRLNEVFNGMWDFEILDQQVGKDHIWVKGRITVKFMDGRGNLQFITKTQFGGSDVKRTTQGYVIDVGDDLKSAGSDALKKCASLLGVAQDVYFPDKSQAQTTGGKPHDDIDQALGVGGCEHDWHEAVAKTPKNMGKKFRSCNKCNKFEWL